LENFTAKKIAFFLSKISILLSQGLHKDVQATGEAFSTQKRTSNTSKHDTDSLSSLFLWIIFVHLDPDPADQNQCESDTDAQH
jgi:hypothetical protein